ncbi:MAG TPA: hypothetical protein VFZ78_01725 [Flavisolibacter sp.]
MNPSLSVRSLQSFLSRADWKLLLFLVMFLNVKLAVKFAALVLIFLLQRDWRSGLSSLRSGPGIFYMSMAGIALLDMFIFRNYLDTRFTVATGVGMVFWFTSLAAFFQLTIFTRKLSPAAISHTFLVFFILNSLVSFGQLFLIMIETGTLNPYQYQGDFQKYFINTGDHIKGVTFDTSTTNAAINAFGIVYFFFKRNYNLVFLCMCTLLLTASNLVNILLFPVLVALFIFHAGRNQKSILVASLLLMVVFLGKVSPQNTKYLQENVERFLGVTKKPAPGPGILSLRDTPDSLLGRQQRMQKIALLRLDSMHVTQLPAAKTTPLILSMETSKPLLPMDDIHSPPFQQKDDTTSERERIWMFMNQHHISPEADVTVPGKLLAFRQTAVFLREMPKHLLTGTGTGNFSSKLAFRATGFSISGGYPASLSFVHPYFLENHLSLYLNYFGSRERHHSVVHNPFSVYDQVVAEYGLAGLCALLFLYLGFYARRFAALSYGKYIVFLLAAFFLFDYWFEQLSIVVLFELMILLNLKETQADAGSH